MAFLNSLPIWAFDGAHVLGVLFVALPSLVCRRPQPKGILDGGGGSGGDTPTRGGGGGGGGSFGGAGISARRFQRWVLHAGTTAMAANTVVSLAVVLLQR